MKNKSDQDEKKKYHIICETWLELHLSLSYLHTLSYHTAKFHHGKGLRAEQRAYHKSQIKCFLWCLFQLLCYAICITTQTLPGTAVNDNCVPLGNYDSYGWLSRRLMLQVDTSTLFCRNTTSILLKQALKKSTLILRIEKLLYNLTANNFSWYLC